MSDTAVIRRIESAAVLLTVFFFMLALNHWMPLHRDDYDYSLIWGTTQHVASLGDVLQSMWNHYMTHGGRMVTVFILDLFLWLGKFWFDLANAAVFTALVVLLCCHSLRSAKFYNRPGMLALSALLLWLCLPHFGEVAVWKSGSTVYLWSGCLARSSFCRTICFWRGDCIGAQEWRCPCFSSVFLVAGPWKIWR